jgi:hypothetical protein
MRFVLIHGAYHGAWCWARLGTELEGRGHAVVAPDLPTEDPDAGAEAYAAAVLESIPGPAADTIVVGHSLAGLILPLVAGLTPTRRMVFLCALVPVAGMSFDAQHVDTNTGFVPSEVPVAHPDGSASWPVQGAVEMFFHDCDPDLARDAARRLRRQHWRITQETTPLAVWPDVPASSVIATGDRAVAPVYLQRVARDRLGVEPVEIAGGHSPFLARPAELATVLERLAGTGR